MYDLFESLNRAHELDEANASDMSQHEGSTQDRNAVKRRVDELIGMCDWSRWSEFTRPDNGDPSSPYIRRTKSVDGGIRVDVYLGWDLGHSKHIEGFLKATKEKFEALRDIIKKHEPTWSVKLTKSHGSRGVTWTNYWVQITVPNTEE